MCLCARVCVCAYDPIFDLNTLDKLLLAFMRIDSFFFCMGEGSNISILHVAPRRVDVIITLLFLQGMSIGIISPWAIGVTAFKRNLATK